MEGLALHAAPRSEDTYLKRDLWVLASRSALADLSLAFL